MPSALSNSRENCARASAILCGFSANPPHIRSADSGRRRMISAAAIINERLLFTSWRKPASFLFNSPICSGFRMTGSLGRDIVEQSRMRTQNQAGVVGTLFSIIGASEGIRTLDIHLGKVTLYQTELRS